MACVLKTRAQYKSSSVRGANAKTIYRVHSRGVEGGGYLRLIVIPLI